MADSAVTCRRGGLLLSSLAAAALLFAPGHANAAVGPPGTSNITQTTSTTDETTITNITAPGGGGVAPVVPGSGPLTSQLNQLLAGPNGAVIQSALNRIGVLGPATPTTFVGDTLVGTNTTVTTTGTIGPATIRIGVDQSQSFFVAAGTEDFNTNTDNQTFLDALYRSTQPLSTPGANFLLGDLHTTVQTTIIDEDFDFINGLLNRGGTAGTAAAMGVPLSMQYAETSFTDDAAPSGNVLAYAPSNNFPVLLK